MMVNYKIVNDKQLIDIGGGYVEQGGDILETKTDQIVLSGLGMRKAKEMVRHLNFGGGFDGFTPSFFLAKTKFSFNESTFLV
jgi:hypothetical protein